MDMEQEYRTKAVLSDVFAERVRQHLKWGVQHHPDGTGEDMRDLADHARATCEAAFAAGTGTWADILGEEFWEALAEADLDRLETELIHTAAVAVSWVEDIRSRRITQSSEQSPES